MDLRWFLDLDVAGSIGGAATAILHRALHGVRSGLQAGSIERSIRAGAANLAARSGITVCQRITVRIAARAGDSGVLARQNGAALDRQGRCRGTIRPRLDL